MDATDMQVQLISTVALNGIVFLCGLEEYKIDITADITYTTKTKEQFPSKPEAFCESPEAPPPSLE